MSSNRKVYARQVPWERQESPWDDEQLKIDKAALYGKGHTEDTFLMSLSR